MRNALFAEDGKIYKSLIIWNGLKSETLVNGFLIIPWLLILRIHLSHSFTLCATCDLVSHFSHFC